MCQALNARHLSKGKGCHSCCSAALVNGNGKTASKEEAEKLDTQLSFQAPLPEEWRMWCECLFFKLSCIVFGEERANLNTAIIIMFSSSHGNKLQNVQGISREYRMMKIMMSHL